ncbi:MAG: hypothetical protein CM1200mP2_33110 [Planctomycetaceae bacterium]|nr:MAG: hypothetical protein CM1200mP2_33110 [Planctomycetaceae bacterium]
MRSRLRIRKKSKRRWPKFNGPGYRLAVRLAVPGRISGFTSRNNVLPGHVRAARGRRNRYYRLHDSGVTDQLADLLAAIPGGVGNVMIPFAMASPWLILATLTAIPALFVRAMRRRRVARLMKTCHSFSICSIPWRRRASGLMPRSIGFWMPNHPNAPRAGTEVISVRHPRRSATHRISSTAVATVAGADVLDFHLRHHPGRAGWSGDRSDTSHPGDRIPSRRRERAAAAAMSVPTK